MSLQLDEKLLRKIQTNSRFRKTLGSQSLAAFMGIYLPHHLKAVAPMFADQLYGDLEDEEIKFLEVIAFRGSTKSTNTSLGFVLQRALYGIDPFIIPISDTHTQAKQIITNIVYELENNDRIKFDFGVQKNRDNDWTATNIVLPNTVRIMSRSRGQRVRGLRHLQYRPTLIIADDIENIDDVRTIEQRDKTEEWWLSDVMPSLDPTSGRTILLGNLLHSDSLIARTRNRIDKGDQNGVVRVYPLIDERGNNMWPEVYTPEKIEELKNQGERYFSREYLLKIVESDDQVVHELKRYDTPPKKEDIRRITIGVDLAISQKDTADFTALCASCKLSSGKIYTLRTKYGRYNFNETLAVIEQFYKDMKNVYPNVPVEVGIENVAYQQAAIEEAQRRFTFKVTGIRQPNDKRANLESFAPQIERGEIVVREKGQEDLVIQIVHFGYEAHDDLMDAAMISWRMLVEETSPKFSWLA